MGLRDRLKQGLKRALGVEPEARPAPAAPSVRPAAIDPVEGARRSAESRRVEEAAARAEAARVEADRVEAARVEAARVEAARVEAARVEAARVEAARAATVPSEAVLPVSPLPKNIQSDNDAPLRDAHIRGTFTTSGSGYVVHLVNEALAIDLRVPCEPGEFVLDAADRAGFEMPSSCRTGGCLTCAAKLLGGETEMDEQYTLEEEHIADGFRLLCCTTVSSDATFVTHQQDAIH